MRTRLQLQLWTNGTLEEHLPATTFAEIFYLPLLYFFFPLNIIFIPLFPFPLFYIFIPLFVFPLSFSFRRSSDIYDGDCLVSAYAVLC